MRRPCIVSIPTNAAGMAGGDMPGFVLCIGVLQDGDESSFCMLVEREDGTCDDYASSLVRFTDGAEVGAGQ